MEEHKMKIAFNLNSETCEVDIYVSEKSLKNQIEKLKRDFPLRKNVTEDLSELMAQALFKAMEKVCKIAELDVADLKPRKFVCWKHQSEVPMHLRETNL